MPDIQQQSMRRRLSGYYTGIPTEEWSPSNSYLISRLLVMRGIVEGRAMIGTRRTALERIKSPDSSAIYTVKSTQYGWIELSDGLLMDPFKSLHNSAGGDLEAWVVEDDSGCYVDGVDPLTCSPDMLPKHHEADEIYPLRSGIVREVCGRILKLEQHVQGLTMAEAAYVTSRPLAAFGDRSRVMYEYFIHIGLNRLLPLSQVKKVHPLLAQRHRLAFYDDIEFRN